jgi:opacity protein-like surface antigen
MRKIIAASAVLALLAGTALAQQPAPPAANGPQNGAINSSDKPSTAAPVAGRNSFTEGEAKSRIEAKGFSNLTDLKKDDSGVWRGQAKQSGKSVTVSLDYQGNIVAR